MTSECEKTTINYRWVTNERKKQVRVNCWATTSIQNSFDASCNIFSKSLNSEGGNEQNYFKETP